MWFTDGQRGVDELVRAVQVGGRVPAQPRQLLSRPVGHVEHHQLPQQPLAARARHALAEHALAERTQRVEYFQDRLLYQVGTISTCF